MMYRSMTWLKNPDPRILNEFARISLTLLRISLGIVFLWFGVLKFFPELSPAEELATRTIEVLTLGIVQPALSRQGWLSGRCSSGLVSSRIASSA